MLLLKYSTPKTAFIVQSLALQRATIIRQNQAMLQMNSIDRATFLFT